MNEGIRKHKQFTFNFVSAKESIRVKQINSSKTIPVLFRNMIPEIPSTTYGTFSIYKYPAKFIPQVIAYALNEYAEPGYESI